MKSFIRAFKELIERQANKDQSPRLTYYKGTYMVSIYYSDELLKRIGAEIIL